MWMSEVSTTSSKLQHKPSVDYFDKSLTALSIGPCDKLPQITWSQLSTVRCVCWHAVLIEDELGGQPALALKER